MKEEQVYIDVVSSIIVKVKACYLATRLAERRATITKGADRLVVEGIFIAFVSEIVQELEKIKPEGMQLCAEYKANELGNN
jgi:hypothetical protein